MEHQALYRKYRPRAFEDVCGQEHITSVLKYESEHGKLSHAYLFCGPRGTGKTTCAKILSKAVNCDNVVNGDPCGVCYKCTSIDDGSATDVVEMDAASNTGVEYIRDIRDEVAYTPAIMKKRVYIIDEVHMLSMGAFNALLKTLEEPPEHVVFILATTEQHKLPATIISRCQRFDFRRITTENIASRLEYIADKEGISLEHDAALLLAKQAQGGMRDAINLLELCSGGGHAVTVERVRETLGITGLENAYRTALAVKASDYNALFAAVANVVSSSKDISVFWQELISFWRDMLVMKSTSDPKAYLDLTGGEAQIISEAASKFTVADLMYHATILDETLITMSKLPQVKRNLAEMALVKMSSPSLDATTEALLSRIAALEDKIKLLGNAPVAKVQPATQAEAPQPKAEVAKEPEIKVTPQPEKKSAPAAASNWRRVPDTSELLEKISSLSPMLTGFVSKATCFVKVDGSEAKLRVPNSFFLSMLDKEDSKRTLTDAFVLSGLAESGVGISFELGETRDDGTSPMDELEEI